jgi:hypothetical protein
MKIEGLVDFLSRIHLLKTDDCFSCILKICLDLMKNSVPVRLTLSFSFYIPFAMLSHDFFNDITGAAMSSRLIRDKLSDGFDFSNC